MAFDQNNTHGKQNDQAGKAADATKENLNKTTEQTTQFADAARDSMSKMAGLREQVGENTKQAVQKSVETATHHAREATERFTRTLGFTGQDSERLARQSKQNMEAVTRCGTVLSQAFQDASRNWFELSQKQWQRNFESLNKLTSAKTVQEFTVIQSDLVRESLQHMIQDSKIIAETSMRAVDEASKTFSSVAQQSQTSSR